MISGIGPKESLLGLGIHVLIDKPGVGQNMWDHTSFSLVQEVSVETQSGLTDPAKALKAAQDFNRTHTGILTSNGADYIGQGNFSIHKTKPVHFCLSENPII